MDNVRFALFCALGVLGFFLWQAWQADYAAAPEPPARSMERPADAALEDDVPGIEAAPDGKSPEKTAREAGDESGVGLEAASGNDGLPGGERIRVVTDKFVAEIDTYGGDLRRVELRGVPVSRERPGDDLRLLNDRAPNFFIVQSGLIGVESKAPDHRDRYRSPRAEYRLAEGRERLEVPLTWRDGDGRSVTKIYTFTRGAYRIGLRHEVANESGQDWTVSPYVRLWRTPYQHTEDAPFSYSFMGTSWYQAKDDSGYRFEKRAFEDLAEEPLQLEQTGGWLALMQHYFLGAAVPPADTPVNYFARPKSIPGTRLPGYAAGYVGARTPVAAGEGTVLTTDLFVGPKLSDQLAAVAPGLPLTVDYGLLTVIAEPLFWVLDKLHAIVGNWGVAIILLTVLIKLAFYKLSETQFRAMARMRKFAPRIQQLKEQYGDDRQKLQSKMMDLYKKEGFNPLGGCWPLLVQMPVFIALYWVLRESVELRHADFMLWINDLSSPDPYYILPVAFGITMFVQQKLSSSSMTMDPMQQRLMQVMPVGLSVFFAFFPAGLVLYWFVNNLLSIAQQWYIYRKLDHEGIGHKSA